MLAAVATNVAIAVAKFVVAATTGSSALLSEAIHSTVDTGDGLLLWVGLRRSRKPPDAMHPFGHGKELYFWTTVVSILVFALGGGMSLYEGIAHLVHASPPERSAWKYLVLGGSALFEAASWAVALREFVAARRGRGVWETIRTSKNPLVFTVLFEDSAALLGIAVAAAGTFAADVTGSATWDGMASILIGLVLMTVAVLLARESRGLLVGEAADPATIEDIRRVAGADPDVEAVGAVLTVHFGPHTVVLDLDLQFRAGLGGDDVARAVVRVEDRLRAAHPELRWIYIEARALRPAATAAPRL